MIYVARVRGLIHNLFMQSSHITEADVDAAFDEIFVDRRFSPAEFKVAMVAEGAVLEANEDESYSEPDARESDWSMV